MIQDAVEGYEERVDFMKSHKLQKEYGQSIRTLLKYLKWKCDILYDAKRLEECEWLSCVFKEKYSKYVNEVEMSREEELLALSPKKYFKGRKKTNFRKRISLVLHFS